MSAAPVGAVPQGTRTILDIHTLYVPEHRCQKKMLFIETGTSRSPCPSIPALGFAALSLPSARSIVLLKMSRNSSESVVERHNARLDRFHREYGMSAWRVRPSSTRYGTRYGTWCQTLVRP